MDENCNADNPIKIILDYVSGDYCANCEYFYEDVCCNRESSYAADFVDEDDTCNHFERKGNI